MWWDAPSGLNGLLVLSKFDGKKRKGQPKRTWTDVLQLDAEEKLPFSSGERRQAKLLMHKTAPKLTVIATDCTNGHRSLYILENFMTTRCLKYPRFFYCMWFKQTGSDYFFCIPNPFPSIQSASCPKRAGGQVPTSQRKSVEFSSKTEGFYYIFIAKTTCG